jgi:uncharacterized protein (DUF1501 family)
MNTTFLNRRRFIGGAAAASVSLIGGASLPSLALGGNYKALVVIHLNGGNDGNNTLVPTDGAYNDYQAARQNLALPKASLAALPGTAVGHTFGIHPGLAPLVPLYTQGRLGFIANVGPLVEPATAAQVLAGQKRLPAFLLSHSDQTAMVQGWTAQEDNSGWAGRALEQFPSALRNPAAAVTLDTSRTLVLGRNSAVSFMSGAGGQYWGTADLSRPDNVSTQAVNRMASWQFANAYENEYARTFGAAVNDSLLFNRAFQAAVTPSGNFGSDQIGERLRSVASVLPAFKSMGLARQVFLVSWGQFDTHANQRGGGTTTQDTQLAALGQALAAFDASNRASGISGDVLTLVISEFGRTLRPGSGGGSEHAWGSHWIAMGDPILGGTVHGQFPSLVLGGPDDGDFGLNGRHVPKISCDQVGATVMQWMGMPSSSTNTVFPDLANFAQPTVALLRT